jgi:SHS2 domain-containing protein
MSLEDIEYLDHMTDAYLRVKANTLKEVFELAGKGLVNTMYDIHQIEAKKRISISAEGKELENLLFDWLDKILLLMLIDKIVLSEFEIKIIYDNQTCQYEIKGYGEGEKIDSLKHELKVEIKGITYHEMKILEDRIKSQIIVEFIVDL